MKLCRIIAIFLLLTSCLGPGLNPGNFSDRPIDPGGGVGGEATLSSFSPTVGPKGTILTILGDHFVDGVTVTIGGSACEPVTVISPQEIRCEVGVNPPKTYTVQVTNPGGTAQEMSGTFRVKEYLFATGVDGLFAFDIDEGGTLTAFTHSAAAVSYDAAGIHPSGKFVYLRRIGSGNVHAFTIDPSSLTLTEVSGGPYASCAHTGPMAFGANGKFIYVSCADAKLIRFDVDLTTGALSSRTSLDVFNGNKTLVAGKRGRFLYAGGGSSTLQVFSVDDTTGALTGLLSPEPNLASSEPRFHNLLDQFLVYEFSSDEFAGKVYRYRLEEGNVVQPDTQTDLVDGSQAHEFLPNGQILYAANGVLSTFHGYRLSDGAVSEVLAGISLGLSGNVLRMCSDSSSSFLYTLFELEGGGDPQLLGHSINANDGKLTSLFSTSFTATFLKSH